MGFAKHSPAQNDFPWWRTSVALVAFFVLTLGFTLSQAIWGYGYALASQLTRIAATIHACTAVFFFPAMLLQTKRSYRLLNPTMHKRLGKVALISGTIAWLTVPFLCFPVAPESGWLGSVIGIIVWPWFGLTLWKTWRYAIRGAIQLHRTWAVRLFGTTFSIILMRPGVALTSLLLAIFPFPKSVDDLDPAYWGTIGIALGMSLILIWFVTIPAVEWWINQKFFRSPFLSRSDHLLPSVLSRDTIELSGEEVIVQESTPSPDNVAVLTLSIPDSIPGSIDYRVGHHVLLSLDNSTFRPYTMLPGSGKRQVKVAVKGVGAISNALVALRPGSTVHMKGPVGSFVWPSLPSVRHIVFLAGGIGMSGVYPVLHHVLKEAAKPGVRLTLASSGKGQGPFAESLLAEGHSDLKLVPTQTRMTPEFIEGLAGKPVSDSDHSTLFLICGPVAMNTGLRATIEELGFPATSIFGLGTDDR